MSLLLALRQTTRSQAVRIGGKKIPNGPGTVAYVNIDNPRVSRDLGRHNAIGTIWQVGAAHFQNDDGVVLGGAKVANRATGLVLDVSAGTYTTAAGVTRSVAAGTATIGAADTTNPRVDIIAVNTTNDAIVTIAGTATAGATSQNRRGLADVPANRIALAWVVVPANAANVATVNVLDVRP